MRMKADTARCNPSASAQLRLREENMGELDPIPCENDFPLRIRFEAGFEIRNLSMRRFRCKGGTLPETNIAPENRPSQKETSIPTINFQVPC